MMEGTQRRRRVLLTLAVATMLVVSSLQGCTGCAGAGTVAKSVFDSLLPMPSQTVWARCPTPGSHSDSYRDASGSCTNYVYDVEAATSDGTRVTVSIILSVGRHPGRGGSRSTPRVARAGITIASTHRRSRKPRATPWVADDVSRA